MRSPILAALALALTAGAACSSGTSSVASDPDFARDLQLASMATLALPPSPASNLAVMETMPLTTPEPAPRPRAARSGPRRVSSPRASAPSAVTEEPQALGDDGASVELAGGEAAAADVDDGAVALPRPVPVIVGLPSGGGIGGDGDYSRGGRGSVIRGGDIDDCRIHDTRRRPVYRPPARTTGVGGGRWGDVARRPSSTGETSGGRWGDRRPEAPRTGGAEGRRGGSDGTTRGGVWGGTRGRQ